MKLKSYVEKIGQNGEIKIPGDYLKLLGLCPGEEVELKLEDGHLLVEPLKELPTYKKRPAKGPVEELTGSLPLPPELVDELVENEHLFEPQEVD